MYLRRDDGTKCNTRIMRHRSPIVSLLTRYITTPAGNTFAPNTISYASALFRAGPWCAGTVVSLQIKRPLFFCNETSSAGGKWTSGSVEQLVFRRSSYYYYADRFNVRRTVAMTIIYTSTRIRVLTFKTIRCYQSTRVTLSDTHIT